MVLATRNLTAYFCYCYNSIFNSYKLYPLREINANTAVFAVSKITAMVCYRHNKTYI